jgi:Tfp pilus assembly protein PilO
VSVSEAAALYRLHAIKCIDIAHRSADSESRLVLLEMARSWQMLADQADKNAEAATLVYETPESR